MHFKKHIFFCINQKDNNKQCCAAAGALEAWEQAKRKVAKEGLNLNDQVRVSKSGCLGRCAEGPCAVVYPDGIWYTYHNEADIDEIVEEHLKHDRIVSRLLIDKIS